MISINSFKKYRTKSRRSRSRKIRSRRSRIRRSRSKRIIIRKVRSRRSRGRKSRVRRSRVIRSRSRKSRVRRSKRIRSRKVRSRRSRLRKYRNKINRISSQNKKIGKSKSIKIRKPRISLRIKKTLDDGNCFFSSIYRSLKNKNLLDVFYNCLPELQSRDEATFIKKLRKLVAENSVDNITEMFTHFSNIELDEDTFNEISESLGGISEILEEFFNDEKFKPKYKGTFIEKVQDSIKTDKNWVSELEVTSFQNILKTLCNEIGLKIFNTYEKAVTDIKHEHKSDYEKYKNTIYILNQDCQHWVYI